jgi:hypothetical protein
MSIYGNFLCTMPRSKHPSSSHIARLSLAGSKWSCCKGATATCGSASLPSSTTLPPNMTDLSKAKIYWEGATNSRRTDRLIGWLEENPTDRIKLFSDSSQDARAANRRKIVGKESKMYIYIKIANTVFSADDNPQIRDGYMHHMDKFARAVENRLQTYAFHLSLIIY